MKNRLVSLIPLLVCSLFIVGCATSKPAGQGVTTLQQSSADAEYIANIIAPPENEHVAVAKRFLHSFDAGGLAMKSMTEEFDRQASTQNALSELVKRSLEGLDADDFENLAARVYTRHLNQQHMTALATFAESNAGGRFMRISIDQALNGKQANPNELMSQFNADELLQLMKFLQSETFVALQQKIQIINAELKAESGKLGEAMMREYIRKQ